MIDTQEQTVRILIVDDTSRNIQILGPILKKEGYQINIAQNGLQAIKATERVLPDLILLDIMMPELDGFETCEILKASERTRNIPIIFLTAKTETDDIVKGFQLGAVDYITKPFNATELLIRVHTQLTLKFSQDIIQQVSNERKELLHILCHDLANPLNAVITVLNLMRSFQDFEKMRELLLSSAQNGLELIDLVRAMRSLEEHKLQMTSLNLAHMVAESVQLLDKRFKDKFITVNIEINETCQVYVERISFINSVLNNLLTNAVKFSYPHSTIKIHAQQTLRGVELCIHDKGIGMPTSLVHDLFDMSKATSRLGTQEERGTGFGMPLVKKFVTTYGGSVEIFSREEKTDPDDHGTTIKLILPDKPIDN